MYIDTLRFEARESTEYVLFYLISEKCFKHYEPRTRSVRHARNGFLARNASLVQIAKSRGVLRAHVADLLNQANLLVRTTSRGGFKTARI